MLSWVSAVRNLQDLDYFKRCVERFRDAAKAPGRKLFVVSCVVDSPLSLQEIKETNACSSAIPEAVAEDMCAGGSKGMRRGDKASWGYFAPNELANLFESMQQFGVSNFKLAAVVLCVGAASIAEKEPVIVNIPLPLQNSKPGALNCAVMQEIHIAEATGDVDPFKFFEEEANDRAFTSAVLGGLTVCTELDHLKDDYKPAGYRDCVARDSKEQLFVCRCCTESFPSRNRLYAHIRSSPACVQLVEETDAKGFQALMDEKNVASQVFALMIGSPAMDMTDLIENLTISTNSVGQRSEVVWQHLVTDSSNRCLPTVAGTILLKLCCTLRGEALLGRLRDLLASKTLILHSCMPLDKPTALDWQQSSLQQHFAYMLPFQALSEETAEFAERQEVYRKFKQALNYVQKTWQTSENPPHSSNEHALQLKMAQRLSFEKEYVVIKIAGIDLSPSVCLLLVSRSLVTFHSSDCLTGQQLHQLHQLPFQLPVELLYLEGQRFPQVERKHGTKFFSCRPWGDGLQSWRSKLQAMAVATDVDWPSAAKVNRWELLGPGKASQTDDGLKIT